MGFLYLLPFYLRVDANFRMPTCEGVTFLGSSITYFGKICGQTSNYSKVCNFLYFPFSDRSLKNERLHNFPLYTSSLA